MKWLIVIAAAFACGARAAPAKLDALFVPSGYDYKPPLTPSGIYKIPGATTSTKPTTTQPPTTPPRIYFPPFELTTRVVTIKRVLPPTGGKTTMLMPYEFAFGVNDQESRNKFSHSETSDGQYVTGEYSVLLPDNRMQLVRFASNPDDGYKADVTYQYYY